jgi:hypothetical protein
MTENRCKAHEREFLLSIKRFFCLSCITHRKARRRDELPRSSREPNRLAMGHCTGCARHWRSRTGRRVSECACCAAATSSPATATANLGVVEFGLGNANWQRLEEERILARFAPEGRRAESTGARRHSTGMACSAMLANSSKTWYQQAVTYSRGRQYNSTLVATQQFVPPGQRSPSRTASARPECVPAHGVPGMV